MGMDRWWKGRTRVFYSCIKTSPNIVELIDRCYTPYLNDYHVKGTLLLSRVMLCALNDGE
jgi:hypothetical protein